ncbi:hypothetical protein OfM1_14060 [Lactovum odontotermitis]
MAIKEASELRKTGINASVEDIYKFSKENNLIAQGDKKHA